MEQQQLQKEIDKAWVAYHQAGIMRDDAEEAWKKAQATYYELLDARDKLMKREMKQRQAGGTERWHKNWGAS